MVSIVVTKWLNAKYPTSTLEFSEDDDLWVLVLAIDSATSVTCYLREHVVRSSVLFREKVKELVRISLKEIEDEMRVRKANKTLHSVH